MINLQEINRELERTKAKVFIGSNAAFLGSLACSMPVIWDETEKTAATDGVSIWWNPHWFMSLAPSKRITVFVHELWHPALLHFLRCGDRDMLFWNYATDYKINIDMFDAGYDFDGLDCLLDAQYRGMPEETIYAQIYQKPPAGLPVFGGGDMRKPDKQAQQTIINNVVRAYHEAKAAGQAGNLPGAIKETIDKFLSSVIDWDKALDRLLQDMVNAGHTWARPKRRSPDIYLPSRFKEQGKLKKLHYYLDVSGSITRQQILRFNSEGKAIKEKYNPGEMLFVQFDVAIRKETTLLENEDFTEVEVYRGGATSLECVREHILETKPTAAVIFTDLHCHPMGPIPTDMTIIWVVIGNKNKPVPYGQAIYINE